MTAIARALAQLSPEADGVDLAALTAAEHRLALLRSQRDSPIADTPFTPRLQTAGDRRKLKLLGIEVSTTFNLIGMDCLDSSSEVAFECLQNALYAAPRDESLFVISLSNLGACSLRRAKPNPAIRYLRRAVSADEVCMLCLLVVTLWDLWPTYVSPATLLATLQLCLTWTL